MLVEFSAKNYLSFKDKVTISLKARSLKEHKDTNTFNAGYKKIDLVRSIALYGLNASGKSNVLKALKFIVDFIKSSAKESQVNDEINVTNFLFSTATENLPSSFEIIVIIQGVTYRYGFTVNRTDVIEEYLYFTKRHTEIALFNRSQGSVEFFQNFPEGREIYQKKLLRKNALLLSVAAQLNGAVSTNIVNTFSRFIFTSDHISRFPISTSLLTNETQGTLILSLIKAARLGFENIIVESDENLKQIIKNAPEDIRRVFEETSLVKTEHIKLDENNLPVGTVQLRLIDESLGAQKFLSLTVPIIDALVNGKILVADEFTSRMHPQLGAMIIRLFHSSSSNPNDAQFIFATHNTYLMDSRLFRRDQILITEKNESQATVVSDLIDKDVRYDASFEKKYFESIVPSLQATEIKINKQMTFEF